MTAPDDDLLADEGVNAGSAEAIGDPDDTGDGETNEGTGVSGALAAASRSGRPAGEADPAPPLDTDTPEARAARETGPGQQLEAGEG